MLAEDQWLPLIRAIDERLKPIANRPVDIGDPGWAAKLRGSSPLDEAGVRPAAEELLQRLIQAYADGDEAARATIRSLFRRFPSFAWAATLPVRAPQSPRSAVRPSLNSSIVWAAERGPT